MAAATTNVRTRLNLCGEEAHTQTDKTRRDQLDLLLLFNWPANPPKYRRLCWCGIACAMLYITCVFRIYYNMLYVRHKLVYTNMQTHIYVCIYMTTSESPSIIISLLLLSGASRARLGMGFVCGRLSESLCDVHTRLSGDAYSCDQANCYNHYRNTLFVLSFIASQYALKILQYLLLSTTVKK